MHYHLSMYTAEPLLSTDLLCSIQMGDALGLLRHAQLLCPCRRNMRMKSVGRAAGSVYADSTSTKDVLETIKYVNCRRPSPALASRAQQAERGCDGSSSPRCLYSSCLRFKEARRDPHLQIAIVGKQSLRKCDSRSCEQLAADDMQ